MKLRLADWLRCPVCDTGFRLEATSLMRLPGSDNPKPEMKCMDCHVERSEAHRQNGVTPSDCRTCATLEVIRGTLTCERSHRYDIREGVPSFLTPSRASFTSDGTGRGSRTVDTARQIQASFDREWAHFDYDDRTWGKGLDERRHVFLREVDCTPEELPGKSILDAGCGNGSLSDALSRLGCEVIAADVSHSVLRASRYYAARGGTDVHFVQADLHRLPLPRSSFDVIYSSGVLHHNPDTRKAFEAILPLLKPGGRIYIWLYEKISGPRHALKQAMRTVIAPLPAPLKHAFACAWLPQAMLRQHLRTLCGRNTPEDQLRWRERLVLLMDHYTPRYRWEHTQEEVHDWFQAAGLRGVRTSERRAWGFGVLGEKPA